ncbi:MAG UNVERIFIED_CONTAM: hypothetical protein LVR29_13650 [Microcystis novacekii LVE1205-3]|jgi:hypothetical protein
MVTMKGALQFVWFSCWLGTAFTFVVVPRNGKCVTTTATKPATLVVVYAETTEFEAVRVHGIQHSTLS